jgi:hypothetical protein
MVTALTVSVRLGAAAAAEQHDTVLYKGMECGMEISAKYLEGNGGFALLVIPHSLVDGGCGRGCGSDGDGDGDTLDSGDVPEIRLGWGEDGDWGGRLVSPITTSRGCALGPKRDRVLSLLESAGGCCLCLGARNSLRVGFTQRAAAIVRQQWWQ